MDNFRIDITCEGSLLKAMELAFSYHDRAVAYRISAKKGLIFYWVKAENSIDLPFKLDAAGAADFATRWLAEYAYGSQPDHDGDNGKGWRLFNEGWCKVDGEYEAFIAVQPAWAMYGK